MMNQGLKNYIDYISKNEIVIIATNNEECKGIETFLEENGNIRSSGKPYLVGGKPIGPQKGLPLGYNIRSGMFGSPEYYNENGFKTITAAHFIDNCIFYSTITTSNLVGKIATLKSNPFMEATLLITANSESTITGVIIKNTPTYKIGKVLNFNTLQLDVIDDLEIELKIKM